MFIHTYMKSKYFVEKSQQKLPLSGFLKFYEMGSYISPIFFK